MKGFREGFGFGIGMALASPRETRPVIRKRRLTKLVYILSLLWGLYDTFFTKLGQHIFARLMEGVGSPGIYPWMFFHLSISFTCLAFVLAFLWGTTQNGLVTDLGWVGDFIGMIGFAVLLYAFTYEAAHYWWKGFFAPGAEVFAGGAALVYVMREWSGLLPGERGEKQFFGTKVRDITRSGLYPTPGAPIPHTLYMLIQYANEVVPLFWHIYIYPDGREQATQINLRRGTKQV